jgi:hypothetical protein
MSSVRRASRRRPKPARQRALEFLAGSSEGRTTLVMLARGFAPEMLIELARDGLATHTAESYIAAGRRGERVRLWITEAGRKALAEATA